MKHLGAKCCTLPLHILTGTVLKYAGPSNIDPKHLSRLLLAIKLFLQLGRSGWPGYFYKQENGTSLRLECVQ
jgi:hypothetical protein